MVVPTTVLAQLPLSGTVLSVVMSLTTVPTGTAAVSTAALETGNTATSSTTMRAATMTAAALSATASSSVRVEAPTVGVALGTASVKVAATVVPEGPTSPRLHSIH
ncbi:hypothetical protein ACOMHN_011611 [Nucella lapillus]